MGNFMGTPDTAVETETACGKVCNSLCGVCVGFVLFLASIIALGWNEFNYVNNQAVILFVDKNAKEASCTPSGSNMGQGIWASCPVTQVYDLGSNPTVAGIGLFSTSNPALKSTMFEASSQIYQWTESKQQVGEHKTASGSTVKEYVYTYSKKWVSSPVDSSSFYCINGRRSGCRDYYGSQIRNFGTIPASLKTTIAAPDYTVNMGTTYAMNQGLLGAFETKQPVDINKSGQQMLPSLGTVYVGNMGGGQAYISQKSYGSISNPSIGDLQTSFSTAVVTPQVTYVSIVSMQNGGSSGQPAKLASWDTGKSGTMAIVNWASEGQFSLKQMVDEKTSENNALVYAIRFGGWLFMFVSLMLITGPIAAIPELIPCIGGILGEIVGCALCCMNLSISIMLSMFVIGIAWLAARPLLGCGLLAVAVACGAAAFYVRKRFSKPSARDMQANLLSQAESGQRSSGVAVAPAVPATQLAEPRTMAVTVPPGVFPGQLLAIQGPDGRQFQVAVPPNVGPGQQFQVSL
eukprot:TRINITY_DN2393_c0_g1_i1.p1 TRINITY_DN2393_c0_g1~~TRINITY_DN2393_c0_g1_i1.p1  ORF type:complete len:518 (-),score=88.93 TRINITY_DN2393_c0_g1_i1:534-2087(-)